MHCHRNRNSVGSKWGQTTRSSLNPLKLLVYISYGSRLQNLYPQFKSGCRLHNRRGSAYAGLLFFGGARWNTTACCSVETGPSGSVFYIFLILLNHLKQKIHAGRAWIYKNKHKTKAASSLLFSLQRS